MSRVQLAINVTDLDKAIAFYSRLFDTAPAKVKPGYANFAIADPPLKLVLFEGQEGATLNHLGVEVETAEEVASAERRLRGAGLETTGVEDTVCCYAEKTETWMADPDGARWEWYVKSGDGDADQLLARPPATADRPKQPTRAQRRPAARRVRADLSDLCSRMAIISQGEVLLTGDPAGAIERLDGRIWSRVVERSELADYEHDHHVISTRLSGGRTVIHVYADERPAGGFERVRTELTDVYFSTLKRAGAAAA